MGKSRRRRSAGPPTDEIDRAPAEREINRLIPGTSPVKARQFVHVRNGLVAALLSDPRTEEILTRWRRELTDGQDEEFAKRVAREGQVFVVVTLGLPWPWLAYGLLEAFWQAVETGNWTPIAYEADLMAPPMSLHWRTKLGESIDEASARLTGLYEQAQQALQRAKTEWRGPERMKASANDLMSAGAWWYLVNAMKMPVAEVAREFANHAGDPRRTVQLGVRKAQRLLDTVPAAVFNPKGRR
jgi:hypothetical protein